MLVKIIGSLPLGMLYFFSDVIYFLFFRLGGYRKKVVYKNLKRSFPEKSGEEIKGIANRFYRYLAELFVEEFKLYSLNENDLRKIVELKGYETCDKYFDQGKSIIIVCAHYGNFEFGALRATLDLKHRVNTVYKPLNNKAFEAFLQKSRSKFGTNLVPTKKTYENIEAERREGILSATGLASDQAPKPSKGYWMEFLNQDTPVFMGCERIARKYDIPVVYAEVDRIRRGRYVATFTDFCSSPTATGNGEITEQFTMLIEKCIRRKPELWLWTHKRWKHKMPDNLPEEQLSKKYPVSSMHRPASALTAPKDYNRANQESPL